MGEVANTIFEIADSIKPGGSIDVMKETLGRSGKFPDLKELAESGSLESGDVANFMRLAQIGLRNEARAIKKTIRNRREVGRTHLGEGEKNDKVAMARIQKEISDAKFALTVLNAVRMPGPVYVDDLSKQQSAEIVLGQLNPGQYWRFHDEVQELVHPHHESFPLKATVSTLTKAVCKVMKV